MYKCTGTVALETKPISLNDHAISLRSINYNLMASDSLNSTL